MTSLSLLAGRSICCFFLLSGNYLIDFMPVNSGTYKFSSVLTFISVSVTACAQFCIEQQGNACQGFYFCDQTMRCYLTSIQSGAGQQQVQNDTSDGATFCNYYNSKIHWYLAIGKVQPNSRTKSSLRCT